MYLFCFTLLVLSGGVRAPAGGRGEPLEEAEAVDARAEGPTRGEFPPPDKEKCPIISARKMFSRADACSTEWGLEGPGWQADRPRLRDRGYGIT